MDIATILGILCGFSLVFAAIAMGGGIGWFVNIPALMIVLGGTIGVTLVHYPLKSVLGVLGVLKNALFHQETSAIETIKNLVEFSRVARREGILALQSLITHIHDPFLNKGVNLAIDGLEPHVVQEILEIELEKLEKRHKIGAEVFATMGTFSPAMGMLGTLIGLVQMLMQMQDPSKIGPAMAVALLTTFYGMIIAYMICLPISGKLKTRSAQEILMKQLIIEGIKAIQSGDNPRIVEQKLLAFIEPKKRNEVSLEVTALYEDRKRGFRR
ncbi:MAG: motility protein A [Desulfobacterota bacterium]|nr:motility protein A [Thermodesulfobacteriota bacterium]